MSDDLVKRLRSDWFGYDVSLRAIDAMEEAADRIEQLTAERDHAWEMAAKADTQMGQSLADNLQAKAERDEALNQLDSATHSVEVLEKRVAEFMADNARLTAALTDARPYLERGLDKMAFNIIRAALKGETP